MTEIHKIMLRDILSDEALHKLLLNKTNSNINLLCKSHLPNVGTLNQNQFHFDTWCLCVDPFRRTGVDRVSVQNCPETEKHTGTGQQTPHFLINSHFHPGSDCRKRGMRERRPSKRLMSLIDHTLQSHLSPCFCP